MGTAERLTIEEYEKLPDALALNHELVDGELVEVSGNKPQHNFLKMLLSRLLVQAAEASRSGVVITEQEYQFGENAHAPDVSFFRKEKKPLLNYSLRVQRFVPDLAIEIVSWTDTFQRLIRKATLYRKCGVAEVWVFDQDSRVGLVLSDTRHEFLEEAGLFAPAAFPDVRISLTELFDQAIV